MAGTCDRTGLPELWDKLVDRAVTSLMDNQERPIPLHDRAAPAEGPDEATLLLGSMGVKLGFLTQSPTNDQPASAAKPD